MNENKKEFILKYGEHDVIVETGRFAKQADGAVMVTSGGTQVLVTVVSGKESGEMKDFFPLLVDYKERFYAAGKFLGGFQKREARPSNAEILLMRMVDRPFRPLFPEGYYYETIIQANVHSYDPQHDPQVLAGLGAAAALCISDVPFNGPAGFCKVGRIDGKFVLNPALEDWEKSDLEMVVAGSADAILMVEGEANQASEEEMLEAILFGHEHIKKYCKFLADITREVGKVKRAFEPVVANSAVLNAIKKDFTKDIRKCLEVNPKLERQDAVRLLKKTIIEKASSDPTHFGLTEDSNVASEIGQGLEHVLSDTLRADILNDGKRIGGRKLNVVRPIESEVNILKKVHGSSLFTRGETQVLAAVTLGSKEGDQMVDNLAGVSFDKFYLHYTFAPYCVGEARGYRGVGRREIGHGNLAQRALQMVLPEDFSHTVRVACEVTESNGSSSMASVCSGSMALMDAGVQLVAPVAGVAMGLIKEGDNYRILTDILGDEDHLGDMDFKVAGTSSGVTAIQMDIKISGISKEIFRQALQEAKVARMHILGEMSKTIAQPRSEFKEGVPRIMKVKIESDKIGALIGPGGKNVRALQEGYAVTVNAEEDGTILVSGCNVENLHKVINIIDLQFNGPAIGSEFDAVVVSIKDYGAFVDLAPNVSGLVHVSEFADSRVKDVRDYVSEGDIIRVKVLEVDRFGKIKLSAKAAAPIKKKGEGN